jgi:hypothetical protein
MSSERKAALYFQNTRTSRKWHVGSIGRDGTAFWSEDSKRLFLRDEYAADDTKIRVFDLEGGVPHEILGIDKTIRRVLFGHISKYETNLWLTYPQVCFAANDSSTIIAVADAPLAPLAGGPGRGFRLKLTVNLTTLQVVKTETVNTE